MIDDKKIDNEAVSYTQDGYNDYSSDMQDVIKESFKSGAEWAINEFLKDLWHPTSEVPREKAMLLIEISPTKLTPKKLYYVDTFIGEDWEIKCSTMCISRWLDVDDLLPKKGDNIK